MAKKPFIKKKKSREDRLADALIKLSERNEKLKEKKIGTSWLNLF
jgi:hypothetical protein